MKKPRLFAVLPTMLTLGNAVCGFGAITFAAKVGPTATYGNELFIAGLLIFAAMICDMLDGSAARWTNQVSDFGGQLDSLCDAISFGIAPAFLMIQFTNHSNIKYQAFQPIFSYPDRLLWVISALFLICALLRLARFNVETDEEDAHDSFSGLPSPAAAGLVASFPIALSGLRGLARETESQEIAVWLIPAAIISLPLFTFVVACLMVSRIRYPHVFTKLFSGLRSRRHLILLVFSIMTILLVPEMAIPLVFLYFAFKPPIHALGLDILERRKTKKAGA